jgi:hypothetical protein
MTADAAERRTRRVDSAFLAAMVLLSCAPYIGGLGLYSDDWAILWSLHAADGSLRVMWTELMSMGVSTRPVQGILLIGLHALFGVDPLGYHVANSIGLAAAAVLFHLALRALSVPRPIALIVPLIYALLPHYSTDRFWIAAFQANASVLLYFLSLYADLRFLDARRAGWHWKALAAVALVGSVLAYEVTGALFIINMLVLGYAAGVRPGRPLPPAAPRLALALGINLLALAATVAFKLSTTVRAEIAGGLRFRVLRIFTEAMPVHFGEYGLALPVRAVQVLTHYRDAAGIGVSLLIAIAVCVYTLRVLRSSAALPDRAATWMLVMLGGVILFGAGYGVTLTTWEIGFHTTGANNRTAIGAAIGVAVVFTGAIGLATSWLSSRFRALSLALLTGLVCGMSTLVLNAVARFWIEAAHRQHDVIGTMAERLPALPAGTTLLLDGLCPYVGPAPVFATNWDVHGMLRLTRGDPSLDGDVIKPGTEVLREGVRTLLFDDVINIYPYGENLLVLHLPSRTVVVLSDESVAREYLARTRPLDATCDPYTDGDGISVF